MCALISQVSFTESVRGEEDRARENRDGGGGGGKIRKGYTLSTSLMYASRVFTRLAAVC